MTEQDNPVAGQFERDKDRTIEELQLSLDSLQARNAEAERMRDEDAAQTKVGDYYVALERAKSRIHYLEGRVGELEPALREWLEAEQDISGRPDKGWETEAAGRRTQRLIAAKAAATRALTPPMKGPNDEAS